MHFYKLTAFNKAKGIACAIPLFLLLLSGYKQTFAIAERKSYAADSDSNLIASKENLRSSKIVETPIIDAAIKSSYVKSSISVSKPASMYPASTYYSCWDIYNAFPLKDKLTKKDTSLLLILESPENGDYFHPFPGKITSKFGWRDSAQHNGIDIELKKGDKVLAAFDGMVRISRRHPTYGNVVIIRHYNGLETVYAHLSKLKVKPGDVVISGQTVGLGGSTGRSTGNHLHFEVRFKGIPVNPQYLISFTEHKLLYDSLVLEKTRWGLTAYDKNARYHVVKKGDSLSGIAKRYGTSVAVLRQLNQFSTKNVLRAGQKVKISSL